MRFRDDERTEALNDAYRRYVQREREDLSGADDVDTLFARGPEHAARTLARIAVSERLGDVGDAAEDRQRARHAADWDVYRFATDWWITGSLPSRAITPEMVARKNDAIRNARLLTAIEQGVRREAVADEAQRWRRFGRAATRYTLARLAHAAKYILVIEVRVKRAT